MRLEAAKMESKSSHGRNRAGSVGSVVSTYAADYVSGAGSIEGSVSSAPAAPASAASASSRSLRVPCNAEPERDGLDSPKRGRNMVIRKVIGVFWPMWKLIIKLKKTKATKTAARQADQLEWRKNFFCLTIRGDALAVVLG